MHAGSSSRPSREAREDDRHRFATIGTEIVQVSIRLKPLAHLVALAALIAVSILGHDVAMASGHMTHQPAGVAHTHMHAGQMGSDEACAGAHCGARQSQPCCVLGQCLIGVLEVPTLAFPAPVAVDPWRAMAIPQAEIDPPLPFRPPVIG